MCGDEVPGEKEGDACGTSQTKRALRDEVRHRPLPNDANNEQAGCHDTGIDDERMREDALPEWPPLAQQAEAEPRDADRAMPVAQKPPFIPPICVLPLCPGKSHQMVARAGVEWERTINYIAIAASQYRQR